MTPTDRPHRRSVGAAPGPVAHPVRVQRMRTRGWRMPAETIAVGRPSRWGNPYRPEPVTHDGVEAWISAPPVREGALVTVHATKADAVLECVERFRDDVQRPEWAERLAELRGYNLACWCPLSAPCHADVLIEAANC